MVEVTEKMRDAFYGIAEVKDTGAIRHLDEALAAVILAALASPADDRAEDIEGIQKMAEMVGAKFTPYAHPPQQEPARLREAAVELVDRAQVAFLWPNSNARPGEISRFRDAYWALKAALAEDGL